MGCRWCVPVTDHSNNGTGISDQTSQFADVSSVTRNTVRDRETNELVSNASDDLAELNLHSTDYIGKYSPSRQLSPHLLAVAPGQRPSLDDATMQEQECASTDFKTIPCTPDVSPQGPSPAFEQRTSDPWVRDLAVAASRT
mmetsp:Transcript_66126/g.117439  ORF Transcript_66126/g.117439 Transcript_66126/m.117439 type:complete len:141 (-) Transcript_66126:47-469(-)